MSKRSFVLIANRIVSMENVQQCWLDVEENTLRVEYSDGERRNIKLSKAHNQHQVLKELTAYLNGEEFAGTYVN